MTAQAYAAPTGAMEPPEAQSIKSMLHIARILALIFGILLLIGGLIYLGLIAYYASICSTFTGYDAYCGAAFAGAIAYVLYLVIAGVFLFLVWRATKNIEAKVNAHQYEAAKSQTLIWMILGLIFGVILGIILLVAYLKFDPLITWQRNQGAGGAPILAAPAGAAGAPPAGAAGQKFCSSCGAPNAAGAGFCAKCGAALPP